jgi:hypothetical protein
MDKKTFWIIAGVIIVLLLVFLIWQTGQINSIASSSNIANSAAGVPTRAVQSSSGMVGGC